MSDPMTEQVDVRFADPTATKELYLGGCQCPGTPHVAGDIAVVRTQVGWNEIRSAYGAGTMTRPDGSTWYDEAYADVVAVGTFTRSWNLVRLNGRGKPEPRPCTISEVALLDEATFTVLKDHCDQLLEARGRLPNASGGSSESSSPVTASPIRRTPKRRSSTTRSSSAEKGSGPTS